MSTGVATGVMTGWRRSARPAGSLSGAALLAVIVLVALVGGAQGWRLGDSAPRGVHAPAPHGGRAGAAARGAAPAFQLLPGPLPGAPSLMHRGRAALRMQNRNRPVSQS